MKKVIIIPDSFKGTMSSAEICGIVKETVPEFFPHCQVVSIPVADGGEGTVDCIIEATGAKAMECAAVGAYNEPCVGRYARLGDSAVIEMAAVAGLPSVEGRKNPALTTTYGVGMLIRHAIETGCKSIYLGLGGSATNDGGCGCAAALGTVFKDCDGNSFVPVGATLKDIVSVDNSEAEALLRGVTVTVMSDVQNPLCGRNGAAYVFGPQKGADEKMVEMLDDGLRHMSEVILRDMCVDVPDVPGAGAAGGMGAGAMAFLGASLTSGIETVLKLTDFDAQLQDADLIITGEGRLDYQSAQGKVICGVARHTKPAGKPLIAIVGCIGKGAESIYPMGVDAVFQTNRAGLPYEELIPRAADDYRATLRDVLSLLSVNTIARRNK